MSNIETVRDAHAARRSYRYLPLAHRVNAVRRVTRDLYHIDLAQRTPESAAHYAEALATLKKMEAAL